MLYSSCKIVFEALQVRYIKVCLFAGTLEVHWRANEEEADKRVPPVKRAKVAAVNWSRKEPEYTWGNSTDGAVVRKAELRALYEGYSPSQIFSTIFDDHILTHIIVQTGNYAKQKNEHGFSLSLDDLKRFIGILLLSGYHSLPRQKLYWCVDEDVGVPYVAKCMSRNRFYEIKRFLHLADNDLIGGSTDRMYKVHPLMNLLNERFQQHGIFHRNLSVDESMVKYFGHHPCKQFMRGKPIRFGYKNWMMCSDDGYCYAFDTYCGKSAKTDNNPLGSRVVLSLLEATSNPSDHIVFFDNFFTSHSLLVALRNKGFRATGTLRENRQMKCPLPSKKEMEKKQRGHFSHCFDPVGEVLLVKWKDSSVVTMATNYDGIVPMCSVKRWSSSAQEKVNVQQPKLFSSYNCSMGGVDLLDQAANNYRVCIRGKKWWWPLFTQMLNVAVVNSWKIHQLIADEPVDLLAFLRNVTRYYLRLGTKDHYIRRRPASIVSDIVLDKGGHFPSKLEKQLRCQYCHKRSMWACAKCNITLCLKHGCFKKFHASK